VFELVRQDIQRQILDQPNQFGAVAGVPSVGLDPGVIAAAQHPMDYFVIRNPNNPPAWAAGIHGEVAGHPGFTGATAADRAHAAGFSGDGSEVLGGGGDPLSAVDGLIGAPFHRLALLSRRLSRIGTGFGWEYSDEACTPTEDPLQRTMRGTLDMTVIELGMATAEHVSPNGYRLSR
jgi:hypothetical protein